MHDQNTTQKTIQCSVRLRISRLCKAVLQLIRQATSLEAIHLANYYLHGYLVLLHGKDKSKDLRYQGNYCVDLYL